MSLLPHQERVLDEHVKVKQMTEDLNTFISSEKFKYVDEKEKPLLLQQYSVMSQYQNILELRIKLHKNGK